MNVRQIIEAYLKANSFDGLFYEDECACSLDDLMPCSDSCEECEPGYKVPCDCGHHNFHIGTKDIKEGKAGPE